MILTRRRAALAVGVMSVATLAVPKQAFGLAIDRRRRGLLFTSFTPEPADAGDA